MKFLLVALLVATASGSFVPLYKVNERIDGSYFVVLHDSESLSAALDHIHDSPFFSILGGRIDRVYGTVLNGFSATLTDKALEFIRSMNIVKYVEEVGIARTLNVASWGLDRIDQRELPLDNIYNSPAYSEETEVHVYVIDTGILPTHVDFEGRATADADYALLQGIQQGVDCNGHGTHCAGTVGGGSYGVAPKTSLHGVRVLGCVGSGSFDAVIAGMDYVASSGQRPAVASMSLGGGYSMAVNDAVQRLHDAGVTTVVAAGNSDTDACGTSPAGAEKAYCVGATDSSDARAYFSNFGECLDIFAPGVAITSAWIGSDSESITISGTSMACPHVAGAAALLLQGDSNLSADDVKAALSERATADLVSDPQPGSPNLLLYVGN